MSCRKPTSQQIVSRISGICKKEGLQVTDSTLQALSEGSGGDVRHVLGQLGMIAVSARTLSYDEAKVALNPAAFVLP